MWKQANQAYLLKLQKSPLLTKSVTSGIFNGLNEIISSLVAGQQVEGLKIAKMLFYGSVILTPTSHQLYGLLNQVFPTGKLWKSKTLQIVISLSTITPILSFLFTTWVSLNNRYRPKSVGLAELYRIRGVVKQGLEESYTRNLKSSLATSVCCLVVAQNYIDPQLWVVFFNLVYFVLGTYQNAKIKEKNAKIKEKAKIKEETKITAKEEAEK